MIWALHGAVGMAADWRDFASAAPAGWGGVRRLDLWRFLDCCPMPLDKLGDVLAEEVVRVDEAPVLLGYSMGGRLALHALLARPEVWQAVVLVSVHPGLADEAERAERRERDAEWSALALKGEWEDFLRQWNAQDVLAGVEMPDRGRLRQRRASVARSFVDWSLGVQENLTGKLSEVECPVLWVTGEQDGKFTGIAEQVVPGMQAGEHVVIPDCGHRVPWEKPGEFLAVCERFLSKHLKDGA